MGSFDLTCAISNLGIGSGDPVRVLFLNQNPYPDERQHGSTSYWYPRALPFRAVYADYATIRAIPREDMPLVKAVRAGFDLDILDKGWGDNAAHDVPTSQGMTLEALMEAAWEKRLTVGKVREKENYAWRSPPPPKGVPTKKRLEAILDPVFPRWQGYGSGRVKNGYMLQRKGYGQYRVRWSTSYDKGPDKLAEMQALLGDYATMIASGSGSYADHGELWVTAKPGPDIHGVGSRRPTGERPCESSFALIREDVWQALVADPAPRPSYSTTSLSLTALINDMGRFALVERSRLAEKDPLKRMIDIGTYHDGPASHLYQKDEFPFRMGLATYFRLLLGQVKAKNQEPFVRLAAEMALIRYWMTYVRRYWLPVGGVGPQFAERLVELDFCRRMANVVSPLAAKEVEDQAEGGP